MNIHIFFTLTLDGDVLLDLAIAALKKEPPLLSYWLQGWMAPELVSTK
jgi:hypothetical protein